MNPRTRLPLLSLVCALFVLAFAGTASAVTLTPTPYPLAGSNFQGGDGDQANPVASPQTTPVNDLGGAYPRPDLPPDNALNKNSASKPDGFSDVDWQSVPGAPGASDSLVPGDKAFAGGDKESEPGLWGFQFEGAGVNPSKDNLLAAWSTSSANVSGPASTFLNLAFTRQAQTGNTFITFELNQLTTTWNNGPGGAGGTVIPCRITGDLLISYEVASGGSPPNVDVIVYSWVTDTFQTVTNPDDAANPFHCGRTGHFITVDPQPNAEAAINKNDIDPNYLTNGGLGGQVFQSGTFGEASLNLTNILTSAGSDICTNFGQIGMHTRSSTSIDSQLQDYITPVPVLARSCKLKLDKQVQVNSTSAGGWHEGTAADPVTAHLNDVLNYKIVVSNTGSQPLVVSTTDNKCGGALYTDSAFQHLAPATVTVQPSQTATYYCSHLVTQTDVDSGSYVNQACTSGVTVTGSHQATGDPNAAALCDTVTVQFLDPQLSVTKQERRNSTGAYVDGPLDAHATDTINYKLTVTNPSATTDMFAVTVTDPKCGTQTYVAAESSAGVVEHTGPPKTYDIPAGAHAVFTCSHTVTAADAPTYTNKVCVDGKDAAGTHPADTDPNTAGVQADCDSVIVHVIDPQLSVTKQERRNGAGSFVDGPLDAHDTDVIGYELTASNPSATTDMFAVTVTDPNCGSQTFDSAASSAGVAEHAGPPKTYDIPAGGHAVFHCSHTINSSVDPSTYTNKVCVDGTDSLGAHPADIDPGTAGVQAACDSVIVHIIDPKLSVTKQEHRNGQGAYVDGPLDAHDTDVIGYELTVTNPSATTDMFAVTVTDPNCGTQTFDSAASSAGVVEHAGPPKTYDLPAAAHAVFHCSHTINSSVDPSTYTNKVCVDGTDSLGAHPADIDPFTAGVQAACDSVVVHVIDPKLSVTKQERRNGAGSFVDGPLDAHAGDTIGYELTASNPSATTDMFAVTVTDPNCGTQTFDSAASSAGVVEHAGSPKTYDIPAAAHAVFHCSHDIAAGDAPAYSNKVCVDGQDALGSHPADIDPGTAGVQAACDSVVVHVIDPKLSVTKQERRNGQGAYVDGPLDAYTGDTIGYELTASNPSATTDMFAVTVTDPNCGTQTFDSAASSAGVVEHAGSPKTYDIPAAAHAVFHCSHDIAAGDAPTYSNKVCVDGTDSLGAHPADIDPGTAGVQAACDSVVVHVVIPGLAIDKVVSETGNANDFHKDIGLHVGATAHYRITITNTGTANADLTQVELHEKVAVCDSAPQGPAGFNGNLAQGASVVFTCDHVVTANDTDPIVNTACTTGMDKLQTVLGSGDTICSSATVHVGRYAISGLKFEDQNADGQQNAGEPVLKDWTIYIDDNNNSHLDAGERSTTTNANGAWSFDGLNPGDYVVREVNPSGWNCATPSPCEFDVHFNVQDSDRTDLRFGNWKDSSVAGTKFHDRDGDGAAREAGEEGLSGWTFYVDYNGNGKPDSGEPSAVSGSNGDFKIDGIKLGAFTIREVGQANWTCSFPSTCSYDRTFTSGSAKTGIDFGNWEPASVSGTKYEDKNNNGTRDAGETGLAGVTIYVDLNGNNALDTGEPTGVSDASGAWSIGGIKPGTFNVLEVPVPNYTCTQPAGTCGYNLTFQAGDNQTDKVFGNAPPAQLVLPERVTPGAAKLQGPTGCTAKAFNARIRGTKVATVTFVLDGKTIKRFTKTNKTGVFTVRINPAKMKIGVHRLVVSVTFAKGSGTAPKKLRLSFQHCAKKLAAPRFTG